ncbi:MAG: DUF3326 domain-containing protein [Cyanobacteria bacterium HKST-UBA04]|nr:DUF3326 domain-containing protein [Cyanobacteria bacterium HKST-UBA04]
MAHRPFITVLLIPTGIGARIGGFGGDAMTLLPLFASASDWVVTHPNVANAACFQTLPDNVLYVEGAALDRWSRGLWQLAPVRQNRVGIIWDSGLEPAMRVLHQNTAEAVSTVYGVAVTGFADTAEPVVLQLETALSGRSTGSIKNLSVLLEAAHRLVEDGAQAIAVCCGMPELGAEAEAAYKQGQGPDPIGGLEAMISHALVEHLERPVAHVPVFGQAEALPVVEEVLDPRAASEFIVPTFLPCVLTGLARAPQYQPQGPANDLSWDDGFQGAVVCPADALGSVPVLRALQAGVPVLAVENNPTCMDTTAEGLGVSERVTRCSSYLEALGHVHALRQGISLPVHITTAV